MEVGEASPLSRNTRWEARWVTRWECGCTPTSESPPRTHPVGSPEHPVGTPMTPPTRVTAQRWEAQINFLVCTKRPTRHLSYISTDLFWTKISTGNTKVAFLPVSQHFFVWEKPFYIQSHKIFPIQKICGSVTKKFSSQNPKSKQATNW